MQFPEFQQESAKADARWRRLPAIGEARIPRTHGRAAGRLLLSASLLVHLCTAGTLQAANRAPPRRPKPDSAEHVQGPAVPVPPKIGGSVAPTRRSMRVRHAAASSAAPDEPEDIESPEKLRPAPSAPFEPVDVGDVLVGLARNEVIPSTGEEFLVDLPTSLRLAESANPTIGLGRQAICEALALQLEARGMLLPSLNAGMNYHLHQGRLQTSFGEIRSLNEQALYFGGGARTLAAETVAIPAVKIFSHLGDAYYAPLAAAQVVSERSSQSHAITNVVLLEVVSRYLELVAAEATLDAIHHSEDDLQKVVLATAAFAKTGQGRVGDFNRAKTQALLLHSRERQLQEKVVIAAAELSRSLHLDPSIRLKTRGGAIEFVQLVDPDYTERQLVQMAHVARPELAARGAEIAASEYRLQQENMRPFFPTLAVGFSGGAFGGGSNRQDLGVPSFFQRLGGRTDFDVVAYWTLQNMGAGNAALQKQRRADRDRVVAERGRMFNQIGREVGDAYAMSASRRQQLALAQRRLQTAAEGAREEINRTRAGEGLPLEVINSVDLLVEAREAMIRALVEYNLSQFQLFVAIGQTPDVALPDPLRTDGSEPASNDGPR